MTKRKQKSSSTTNSTATMTPNVPGYISGPYQQFFGQVANMANGQAPGPSTTQQAAFANALNLNTGNFGPAMDATRSLFGFQPGSVEAGQLASTNLSPYMNPYTDEVIGKSLNDLDRFRQMAISDQQGAATRAGAYGGSRHGVADALTNERFIDQAGNLASQLRLQGYGQAQDAARFDIGNRYNADLANIANRLAAAGFNLNTAGQMGNLAGAESDAARANTGLQLAAGEMERQTDPTQARLNYLAQIAQIMGINPSDLFGRTITEQGTQSGSSSSSGSTLDSLGRILSIGSLFG